MKTSTLKRLGAVFLPVLLPSALLGQSGLGVTLAPLTSFGGGDGWLAPGEGGYSFLGTGNNERGFAFGNGRLYLVSRAGGVNVRILDRTTGADVGSLNTTGITGGTFAVNMVGVGGDGAIYVGNLTTAASSPFKVYKWANESDEPTVAYNVNPGLPRIGDSFAVRGSGDSTVIVASGTGSAGFASFSGGNGHPRGHLAPRRVRRECRHLAPQRPNYLRVGTPPVLHGNRRHGTPRHRGHGLLLGPCL